MVMPYQVCRAVFLLLVPLAAAGARAAAPAALTELQGVYSRELAALQTNAEARVQESRRSYATALEKLENDARQAGDLAAFRTIAAERARFGASQALTRSMVTDAALADLAQGLGAAPAAAGDGEGWRRRVDALGAAEEAWAADPLNPVRTENLRAARRALRPGPGGRPGRRP